jgi:hypothetical protein
VVESPVRIVGQSPLSLVESSLNKDRSEDALKTVLSVCVCVKVLTEVLISFEMNTVTSYLSYLHITAARYCASEVSLGLRHISVTYLLHRL